MYEEEDPQERPFNNEIIDLFKEEFILINKDIEIIKNADNHLLEILRKRKKLSIDEKLSKWNEHNKKYYFFIKQSINMFEEKVNEKIKDIPYY